MSAERVAQELRGVLAGAGLSGSFLVRDLSTGEEIGIDPDIEFPVASLVKVPLAVAVLDRIHDGRIDGAAMIDVEPGRIASPGPVGLSRFRHPARIAVDDLLYLSTALSDNAASDALFDLVPPTEVNRPCATPESAASQSGTACVTSSKPRPSNSTRAMCTSPTHSRSDHARQVAATRSPNSM